jgi:hypothetical protein
VYCIDKNFAWDLLTAENMEIAFDVASTNFIFILQSFEDFVLFFFQARGLWGKDGRTAYIHRWLAANLFEVEFF